MTPHELVTGRLMPTPCLRTSGKGPSLALLEDEMQKYVTYMVNLHKRISTYVSARQARQEGQAELEEQTRNTVQTGDKVFVKVFRRKWYTERREGPFEVIRSTGTAVQVKGSPTWYHLSHCVKAPGEEATQSQIQEVEGSREPDNDAGEHAPDRRMHENPQSQNSEGEAVQEEDNVDVPVHTSDDAGDVCTGDGQGNGYRDIVIQHVPDTARPSSVGCDVPGVSQRSEPTTGQLREVGGQRSPRPVRKRLKPNRYKDQG